MPVRIHAPENLSLFKRITYPPVRGLFFFLFGYLAYKPIRRINKPSLEGPLLWASSHSNLLCDVVVGAYECPRPAKFLAKATLFRFPMKSFFTYCGALPLVRPQDLSKFDPDTKRMQNRSTFKVAIAALKDHWPVAIFPEGTSLPLPGLVLPLKLGVAKLAFSAEEANDFNLGLRIIPVGLEYGSRDRIASGLTIRYGKPILIRDYKELYESASEEAVGKVMKILTEELIRIFPHFESEESQVLGTKLVTTGLVEGKYVAAQLFLQHKSNPVFVHHLKEMVQELEEKSKEAGIPLPAWGYRKIWKELKLGTRLRLFFGAFLGAPLAVWHIACNTLPEYLLRGVVEITAADATEKMTNRFILAIPLLPLVYWLEFWILKTTILTSPRFYFCGSFIAFCFFNIFTWYVMVYWKRNVKMLFSVIVFYRWQERTHKLRDLYKKISSVL